jgi:hypothetical protein
MLAVGSEERFKGPRKKRSVVHDGTAKGTDGGSRSTFKIFPINSR